MIGLSTDAGCEKCNIAFRVFTISVSGFGIFGVLYSVYL
jgi:hypothetical protein